MESPLESDPLRSSSRRCFSPIRFCLPQNYSSSPKLWQRPRCCLWNVAPRKWWDPYPTPCCLTSFMEIFPNNASMTAYTPCLALRAQCFALKEVFYRLSAWLTHQEMEAQNLHLDHPLSLVPMEQDCWRHGTSIFRFPMG